MRTFKGFIIKCVLFLVPFFVLAGIYFYDDPFKVLREYKKYDNDPIFLNEDYIGWKTYKNFRDSLHFDSFILGNSCTMAFLTSDWEKYLNGSKAIRLYGTAERLAAIHRKVMTLDKEEEHIVYKVIPTAVAKDMTEQPDIEQRIFQRRAVDTEQMGRCPAAGPLPQEQHPQREQKKREDDRGVVLQLQRKFWLFRKRFILSQPTALPQALKFGLNRFIVAHSG